MILSFRIFKKLYIPNCNSWQDEILWKISPPPHNVSHVGCHVSSFKYPFSVFFVGQSGGASQWRVCYQRGLPCLVLLLNGCISTIQCGALEYMWVPWRAVNSITRYLIVILSKQAFFPIILICQSLNISRLNEIFGFYALYFMPSFFFQFQLRLYRK